MPSSLKKSKIRLENDELCSVRGEHCDNKEILMENIIYIVKRAAVAKKAIITV